MNDMLDRAARWLAVVGRVLLGVYFLIPGLSKITGFAETSASMAEHGVPAVPLLLLLTIVLQVGGGLALIANFRTPIVAFVLAGLTLVINGFMHDFWNMTESLEQQHETQNFVKNLAIMAGLLVLVGKSSERA